MHLPNCPDFLVPPTFHCVNSDTGYDSLQTNTEYIQCTPVKRDISPITDTFYAFVIRIWSGQILFLWPNSPVNRDKNSHQIWNMNSSDFFEKPPRKFAVFSTIVCVLSSFRDHWLPDVYSIHYVTRPNYNRNKICAQHIQNPTKSEWGK